MDKKLVISIVVVFVLGMVLGFVVHGTILHAEYARLPNLMRSEEAMHKLMGLMAIAQLAWAIGFCWIYARGREARPWLGQGLRYGLAVCLLAVVPMYLIYYVIMPFPSDLVAQQIVYDSICTVLTASWWRG
jgi:cytochrome bd-type quinol oxidase subunit 2